MILTDSTRVKIEQAIARGRSRRWMRRELRVTDAEIREAYSGLVAAHMAPESEPRKRKAGAA